MSRGYRHYDNRRTVKDLLKLIITLLAVLLILAVAGLLWGRQFIIRTEDGIRLDIPFLRQEEPVNPPDSSPPVNIVVVPSDKSQVTQPDPPPEPDPEPDPEPEPEVWVRAVSMTLSQLERGGVQAVLDQGANTVVLNMKRDDGYLGYVSQLPMAQSLSAGSDRVTPLLEQLHQAGLRAVARVSCFRDNALGLKGDYAILTNSGYLWCYDSLRLYWTSPANVQIQDYLAGVAGELAALGFDEILLDNCGYPTSGNINWIRRGDAYDPANLNAPVDALLEKVGQALEGTGTVLSVRTSAAVLAGTESPWSGQTAAGLEQAGVRLWLTPEEGTDPVELAREAGISEAEKRVVAAAGAFREGERHLSLLS